LADRNAQRYRDLLTALDISADDFLRTTEPRHRKGVHALWQRLRPQDVYARTYEGLYCTGCEDFYPEKDLIDGACPEHRSPAVPVAEENYFFRLSGYQSQVEQLLDSGQLAVVPRTRLNEVLSFVRGGLQDFSISRPVGRTGGWGTPVPTDPDQTIYVWIDALTNYITGRGFGTNDGWREWWGDGVEKVHVIGKNVWKFHAVYWPALLLSAGLPLPDKLVVHGFLTADGRKIGKSLGNAVDPFECIDEFGCDAVRYYLLRAVPPFGDGDFSRPRLRQLYNVDLANGLGNLVSRLTTLCERSEFGRFVPAETPPLPPHYLPAIEGFEFDKALAALWRVVDELNREIEAVKPWELLKAGRPGPLQDHLRAWLGEVHGATYWLQPFLPGAAAKVLAALNGGQIRRCPPMFPRLQG
jgi:methionyl-tRNA synthetase